MTSILIIEDNFKMRCGLVELLTDEGYSVDSTGNGKHGLECIKKKDYEIILTDLIMPFIGGMEILHQVKQSNPKTHVILGLIALDRKSTRLNSSHSQISY